MNLRGARLLHCCHDDDDDGGSTSSTAGDDSTDDGGHSKEYDIGFAFQMAFIAAASTMLGLLCLCHPWMADTKYLAAGLGLAGGVMVAAFAEMQGHTVQYFDSWSSEFKTPIATAFFFLGIVFAGALNQVIHRLQDDPDAATASDAPVVSDPSEELKTDAAETLPDGTGHNKDTEAHIDLGHVGKMKHLGVTVGLGIALHNLAEGAAIFIASLSDRSLGAALALAMFCHNVPEGISVAIPIYHATGRMGDSYCWVLFTALSELAGAGVSYLILVAGNGTISDSAFGVMYALTSGIMAWISLAGLIPKAVECDAEKKIAVPAIITGVALMYTSIALFAF